MVTRLKRWSGVCTFLALFYPLPLMATTTQCDPALDVVTEFLLGQDTRVDLYAYIPENFEVNAGDPRLPEQNRFIPGTQSPYSAFRNLPDGYYLFVQGDKGALLTSRGILESEKRGVVPFAAGHSGLETELRVRRQTPDASGEFLKIGNKIIWASNRSGTLRQEFSTLHNFFNVLKNTPEISDLIDGTHLLEQRGNAYVLKEIFQP